ncbi:hypothetical protein C8J56DRAFT_1040375 [Mycena floridula]|nr:hypothetical protein C8J56DRAFT_1040375 [Mycena floridula]
MFINSSPADVIQRLNKPPRSPVACRACRKRKVKCEIDEKNPQNPCKRCSHRQLTCEYITVAEDPDAAISSSPRPSDSSVPIKQETPSSNMTSYIRRPPSQRQTGAGNLYQNDPAYRSQEMKFYTSEPFQNNASNFPQPSRPTGHPSLQQNHLPRPVPQYVVDEALTMQNFMNMGWSSPTTERRDNLDPNNMFQPMYQQPR